MTEISGEGVFPFVAGHRTGTLLFCFHHAGGSASVYRGWVGVNPSIDVVPVELPGKATRRREKWVSDFDKLADMCATEIVDLAAGAPIALYGHSMGAALAYQVAACSRCIGPLYRKPWWWPHGRRPEKPCLGNTTRQWGSVRCAGSLRR